VLITDVVVRRNGVARRITAHGRDIYAITAPIVAEVIERILRGTRTRTGVAAAGELVDADDVLAALERDGHLALQREH